MTTNQKTVTLFILALAFLMFWPLLLKAEAQPWDNTLQVLQALPVHKSDLEEPAADRAARLATYAQHLHAVTNTKHERALLIAVGLHESHFARAVCEGTVLGDQGRAWGCWQSHEVNRSGGVKAQADRAITHLRRTEAFCQTRHGGRVDPVLGAVSLYATGKGCIWAGASTRLATYRKVLKRL